MYSEYNMIYTGPQTKQSACKVSKLTTVSSVTFIQRFPSQCRYFTTTLTWMNNINNTVHQNTSGLNTIINYFFRNEYTWHYIFTYRQQFEFAQQYIWHNLSSFLAVKYVNMSCVCSRLFIDYLHRVRQIKFFCSSRKLFPRLIIRHDVINTNCRVYC